MLKRTKDITELGLLLKPYAKQPIEKWHVFIHERMNKKSTAVLHFCLESSLYQTIKIIRDLVFVRVHKNGRNVIGRIYRNKKNSTCSIYSCSGNKNKNGKVIVRKIIENIF